MQTFWRVCSWAAIGLMASAIVFMLFLGVSLLDRHYNLQILSGCEFLVVAFTCRRATGGAALEIALNLPFLLFYYAPMALLTAASSLLNGTLPPIPFDRWVTWVIIAAALWLILGTIGAVRFIAQFPARIGLPRDLSFRPSGRPRKTGRPGN